MWANIITDCWPLWASNNVTCLFCQSKLGMMKITQNHFAFYCIKLRQDYKCMLKQIWKEENECQGEVDMTDRQGVIGKDRKSHAWPKSARIFCRKPASEYLRLLKSSIPYYSCFLSMNSAGYERYWLPVRSFMLN